MTTTALLLNADYRPIKVIPWVRAVTLLLDEKADLVADYVGRVIHSPSTEMPWPAVVRLRKFANLRGRVRFSRQNVLARDDYRCVYCGTRPRAGRKPDLEELTIDHVIPRALSHGGQVFLPWSRKTVSVTCWENVTTACRACNSAKQDLAPRQDGSAMIWNVQIGGRPATLRLDRFPRNPTSLDALRMSLCRVHIPTEWKDYLPADSGWRGYWDEEIASE